MARACRRCAERHGDSAHVYARVAHAIVYILGIPYLRTLSFFVSWIGMLIIFFQVL